MKKLVVAVMTVLAVLSVAVLSACGDEVPAGAIAAVGDGVVTQEQFDDILAQAKTSYEVNSAEFPAEGTAEYNQIKASIVQYLVEAEMLRQQAAEMNVEVTEEEIQKEMDALIASVGGQKEYEKLLEQMKMTEEQLRQQVAVQQLKVQLQDEIGKSVTVSDEEIKAYYEDPDHAEEFIVEETVDVRHVLVKTKAEALKVQALLEADSSDANWKKVAAKYSTDPGSKSNGGLYAAVPRGRMVKEFENAAFSLKIGEISDPVKSSYGYHVMETTKKTPGSTTSLEDAREGIEAQLKQEKQAKAWEEWIAKLEEDVKILYALGFNPDELSASPSPAATSAGPSASPQSASPAAED